MKRKIHLTQRDIESLERIKHILIAELHQHYTLPELSKLSGLNRYKLTYGFRKVYHTSIYRYLLSVRMNKAKELLSQQEMPVKRIAELCGYSSRQNFSTVFKKYYGVTPGEVVASPSLCSGLQ